MSYFNFMFVLCWRHQMQFPGEKLYLDATTAWPINPLCGERVDFIKILGAAFLYFQFSLKQICVDFHSQILFHWFSLTDFLLHMLKAQKTCANQFQTEINQPFNQGTLNRESVGWQLNTHFSYRVCHGFILKRLILSWIWPLINQALFFWGSWGKIENWLEPKIEPLSGNLACPNPWNAL